MQCCQRVCVILGTSLCVSVRCHAIIRLKSGVDVSTLTDTEGYHNVCCSLPGVTESVLSCVVGDVDELRALISLVVLMIVIVFGCHVPGMRINSKFHEVVLPCC